MRRWAVVGAVAGLLLVLVAQPSKAATGDRLARLTELDLLIENLSPAAHEEGLTEDQLKAELMVQLKAKIPRLKVSEKSRDSLYLRVSLDYSGSEGGRRIGYYGSIEVSLLRDVIVMATGTLATAPVWHKGNLLAGSIRRARSHVNEMIAELVTGFAAAYYEAGNP